jgi:hypothetical protein
MGTEFWQNFCGAECARLAWPRNLFLGRALRRIQAMVRKGDDLNGLDGAVHRYAFLPLRAERR